MRNRIRFMFASVLILGLTACGEETNRAKSQIAVLQTDMATMRSELSKERADKENLRRDIKIERGLRESLSSQNKEQLEKIKELETDLSSVFSQLHVYQNKQDKPKKKKN